MARHAPRLRGLKAASGVAAIVVTAAWVGPAAAQTAPLITDLRVSQVTTSSFTVEWTTDVPATTQLEYGTTRDLGSRSPLDASFVTAHVVALAGLRSSTVYYLRARSSAGGDTAVTEIIATHTASVVLRPSAGSNGIRGPACAGQAGLQPNVPGDFPGLLYADSSAFGPAITVSLIPSGGGAPLAVAASGVHYVDSTLVGLDLPIGGVAEGLYDLQYTQPDHLGQPETQTLFGAFRVFQPFCFSPTFQERKVLLQWGHWLPGEPPGVRSPAFAAQIEDLPGFNGYKIWRSTSPDTGSMQLLRRMNRYVYDTVNRVTVPDTIAWSWRGDERQFADPDSFFFRSVREKIYTVILNGVPQESAWVWVRRPDPERFRSPPHNGVHYYYAITAEDTSGIDITLKSDNLTDIVPQSSPSHSLSRVQVVPNPYYGASWNEPQSGIAIQRAFWDRTADEHKIQFTRLPTHAVVRIYTASGDLVRELTKERPEIDAVDWDVRNADQRVVFPGIYIYRVENTDTGEVARGHLVVIP